MRIKLDTATRGLPEAKREEARKEFLRKFVYSDKFPVQVIWIYVKRIRFMKYGGTMINAQNMLEDSFLPVEYLYGTEDVIAACKCRCFPFHWFVSCLSREQQETQFARKISAV